MLIEHETAVLDEILEWDDVDDAMKYLLVKYSKKALVNARILLQLIPDIADNAIENLSEYAQKHVSAGDWLIKQRCMEPDKSGTFFASMLPIVTVKFPFGTPTDCSEAERVYFDMFLEYFRNPKIFSWERDGLWADLFGYTDYLKLVEQQIKEGNTNA